jgi:hypothetical protein
MLTHPHIKGALLTALVNALEDSDERAFDIAAANIVARLATLNNPLVGVVTRVCTPLASASQLLKNLYGAELTIQKSNSDSDNIASFFLVRVRWNDPQLPLLESELEAYHAFELQRQQLLEGIDTGRYPDLPVFTKMLRDEVLMASGAEITEHKYVAAYAS